jgi:hypothetical protein
MVSASAATGVFGKIQVTFNIHFSHIENPYGVYRAGKRDRTAVPGPLAHRFKVLKCPPKRKSGAIAPLNRGHQYNCLEDIHPHSALFIIRFPLLTLFQTKPIKYLL